MIMGLTKRRYSKEEFAQRGDAIYENKATPRPLARPREIPPAGAPTAAFQRSAREGASEALEAKATPRPAGRERAVNDLSTQPMAPSTSEPGRDSRRTSE